MRKLFATFILGVALHGYSFAQVTIGVVTDVQYAPVPGEPNGRHFDKGPTLLEEAVEQFNKTAGLSFAIDLGDMTDRNYRDYSDLAIVKAGLNGKWYNVFGNHDFSGAKTASEMENVAKLKGLEKPYYSIVQGGIRFIFLNCSDIAVHSSLEGSPERKQAEQWLEDLELIKSPTAKEWDGGLSFKQMAWLDKELTKADRNGQTAIICCHMPIVPFNCSEALWNGMEVAHLIENHPSTKAVFCGHAHGGGYCERNGIHYVNFRGIVTGNDNHFAVVTIDPKLKTIEIDGFGDEPDRSLKIR